MTMRNLIRDNRDEIDNSVKNAYGQKPSNDSERHDWVINDEGLYLWARAEGVPV